jgi:hypothetical protein
MALLTGNSHLLTFLDTNVVQSLHTFGEFIYDGFLSPENRNKLSKLCACSKRRPCMQDDIFALRDLAIMGTRWGWPLAVSSTTKLELGAVKDRDKRRSRVSWCGELAEYFEGNYKELASPKLGSAYSDITHFTHSQRNRLYDYLSALPDENDRVLVVDALEFGCNVFLTMDYKTIWTHREAIRKLGIHVMRPSEFLREPVFR